MKSDNFCKILSSIPSCRQTKYFEQLIPISIHAEKGHIEAKKNLLAVIDTAFL